MTDPSSTPKEPTDPEPEEREQPPEEDTELGVPREPA
jgi:hypothetical protein